MCECLYVCTHMFTNTHTLKHTIAIPTRKSVKVYNQSSLVQSSPDRLDLRQNATSVAAEFSILECST